MQFDTAGRNDIIDKWVAFVGASPRMRFLTGAMPATPATAQSGTLIASLTLPSTWMAAASNGQAVKSGTWTGTSVAIGTIGYARILNSAETIVRWQGTVTAAFTLATSSTTAANSNVLNFAATTGVVVGQSINGPGIPTGTTVVALTGTTVTMSQVSTAGVSSSASIMFGGVSGDMVLTSLVVGSIGQAVTVDTWTLIAPGA